MVFYKRFFFVVVLLFSTINAYAQIGNYEIYLNKVTNNKTKMGYEYQLVNQKDTIYMNIEYSGDFGIVESRHFVLKDVLPDGNFNIYVDNKLKQEAHIKKGFKDGLWIEYNDGGEKKTTPYSKDKIEGVIIEYYKDGTIKRETCIKNSNIKPRVSYTESGIVIMKEYFKENKNY